MQYYDSLVGGRVQLFLSSHKSGMRMRLAPVADAQGGLQQQREQWTDGANTFALAPGVIVLFERNTATTEELARRDFRIVSADDVLLGKEEVSLDSPSRVCIQLHSNEMSRARGGPHCLTHPLIRDDLG